MGWRPIAPQWPDDFLAWLEGLFTAERSDLALWPMVLDELTQVPLAQTENAATRSSPTSPNSTSRSG